MKSLAGLALLATAAAVPVEKLFNLVTAGASNSSHNGLFLSTQTTGPLNSNAVFRDPATAAAFYINGSTVRYQAPNGAPWAMALVKSQDVKGPVEVSVSPSSESTGFAVASNGGLSVSGQNWGGWLGELIPGGCFWSVVPGMKASVDFALMCVQSAILESIGLDFTMSIPRLGVVFLLGVIRPS